MASVGNCVMSAPISATIVRAVIRSIPGRLIQVSTTAAKRAHLLLDTPIELRDPFRQSIPVRQPLLQQKA